MNYELEFIIRYRGMQMDIFNSSWLLAMCLLAKQSVQEHLIWGLHGLLTTFFNSILCINGLDG